MKKPFFLATFSILFSSFSHADTYLRELKLDASTNLITLKTIETEIKTGGLYSPCTVDRLLIQGKYIEWFLEHYEEFKKIDSQIETQLAEVNAHLKKKTRHAEVTIRKKDYPVSGIVQLFSIQALRSKKIPEDQKTIFASQQENPLLNIPEIRRSEAVSAIQNFFTELQSSAPRGVAFSANFPSDYSLSLSIGLPLNFNDVTETVSLPIDLSHPEKLKVTHQAVWDYLIKKDFEIAGYPVDGSKRYAQMESESMDTNCTSAAASEKVAIPSLFEVQHFQYPGKETQAVSQSPHASDFLSKNPILRITVTKRIPSESDKVSTKQGTQGCIFYNITNHDYPEEMILRAMPVFDEADMNYVTLYSVNAKGRISSAFKIQCRTSGNDLRKFESRLTEIGLALLP